MRLFWILAAIVPLLIVSPAIAGELPWVMIDKVPYLALDDWGKRTGFLSFVDAKSGRILLERKKLPPVILLLNSPYALRGGRFLSLPEAPISRGTKVLLSLGSAERTLMPALPAKERQSLEDELANTKGRVGVASCLSEKPVQRIFLDPGHGGADLGTKSGSIREKDITLKFSRLAADQLRRRGFTVTFSRTRDVFLPLEIRPKLAKEWKADLFISIHVNSSPVESVQGTETYILNQEATDAEARKLALIENSIASEATSKESAVQDILWDMEQTSYLQDSAYLASYVQGAIVENLHELFRVKKLQGDWKNRGVRQAPFYVLNRAPMPAILVEIGYLSNPRDRKIMGEKYFQESLAKSLAEGVKKYKEACRKAPL